MMKTDNSYLKKAVALLLMCLSSGLVMAQADTTYWHLPGAKEKTPFFVINNNIIASGLNLINPNDIDSINVMKDNSRMPAQFKNLSRDGIIFIHLKKAIVTKTRSFEEIKQWLDISGDVKFAVDGFYVDDLTLLVPTGSICEINVVKKQQQDKSIPDVINIWTLEPNLRKGPLPPLKGTGKPGTIYIR